MKVHDTGSFPGARAGRRIDGNETQARPGAASPAGTQVLKVSFSSRIAEVEAIREMALAAPDFRPEVVEAARQALADGSLAQVDSQALAERIAEDFGI